MATGAIHRLPGVIGASHAASHFLGSVRGARDMPNCDARESRTVTRASHPFGLECDDETDGADRMLEARFVPSRQLARQRLENAVRRSVGFRREGASPILPPMGDHVGLLRRRP